MAQRKVADTIHKLPHVASQVMQSLAPDGQVVTTEIVGVPASLMQVVAWPVENRDSGAVPMEWYPRRGREQPVKLLARSVTVSATLTHSTNSTLHGRMGEGVKVGSIFSGVGGFDKGLQDAGFEIRWQVEIDEFASKVLEKHWPTVTRYRDIRGIDWTRVEPVDLVCGGFPCQPVSVAGKRLAQSDERWLWPEFLRCLGVLRPRYVLIENVPGLFTAGFADVLSGLAACGFNAEWNCVSAASFGYPHKRERVWIIAYPASAGLEGRQRYSQAAWEALTQSANISRVSARHPRPRANNGLSLEVDRRRALGNAIVPAIAEALGRMILATP